MIAHLFSFCFAHAPFPSQLNNLINFRASIVLTSTCVCLLVCVGDHPLTAEAIARKIGLITTKTRKDVARERGVPLESVSDVIKRYNCRDLTSITLISILQSHTTKCRSDINNHCVVIVHYMPQYL